MKLTMGHGSATVDAERSGIAVDRDARPVCQPVAHSADDSTSGAGEQCAEQAALEDKFEGLTLAELEERSALLKDEMLSFYRTVEGLMNRGQRVWTETIAKGLSRSQTEAYATQAAHAYVAAICSPGEDPVTLYPSYLRSLVSRLVWSALWADAAFTKVSTAHTFAAALMCTDVYPAAVEDLQSPWAAWRLDVPNGLIPIGQGKDEALWEVIAIDIDQSPGRCALSIIINKGIDLAIISGATLADVLLDDAAAAKVSHSMPRTEQSLRVECVCRRYVAGAILSMLSPETARRDRVSGGSHSKGKRSTQPEHRNVIIGRPVRIDARPALRAYLMGQSGGLRGPQGVQSLVRGHWRQQVCGAKRASRKTIWIEPFWRGPEDAPVLASPKRLGAAA